MWLALIRGEVTEAEAADRWGLDVAAVRRIRQVAEQGAMAALSSSPLRTQFRETFGAVRSAQDALRARYRLPPGG